jgi:hypothetical protein
MASKRELLRRAKHEAGHAILALTLGTEFMDVTIVPYQPTSRIHILGDKEPTVGIVRGGLRYEQGSTSYASNWDWACLLMAGLAGERIDRKTSGRFTSTDLFSGAYDDWCKTLVEVRKFSTPAGVDMWVNRILADAWERLKRHKAAHKRLVNLLLEKGTVAYDEVVELYDLGWA